LATERSNAEDEVFFFAFVPSARCKNPNLLEFGFSSFGVVLFFFVLFFFFFLSVLAVFAASAAFDDDFF
jgi:hypothetical protein